MIVKRWIAVAVLAGFGPLLGSCGGGSESGFSGYVADHWPHWAGGMPDDVPPRPGAPGYDEFIAHGQASQDAAKPASPAANPSPVRRCSLSSRRRRPQPQAEHARQRRRRADMPGRSLTPVRQ